MIRAKSSCGLLVPVVLAIACVRLPLWVASAHPTREEIEVLLETERARQLPLDTLTVREIPDIPVPTNLRPCCAFGSEIRVSLAGLLPIPGYRILNILGPDDVGPHTYDSRAFTASGDGRTRPGFDAERNGLVYTCRGGFIDTAHVRDYVDWAVFLAARIAPHAEDGGEITLPDQGGRRRVVVRALPPEIVVSSYGFKQAVTTLAQWLAFQISIWHEIATWYGWASVPGFSERGSAFSPEDLYSNMLGSKLMLAITARREAASEPEYNRAVDGWFARALELLGAVPRDLGNDVTRALDGLWWDSSRRVPDPQLVRRRYFEIGDPIRPWLAPPPALPEGVRRALHAACAGDHAPVVLTNPSSARGITFEDYVTFEVEVEAAIAKQEPFASRGRSLTQRDFPEIVAVIREQAVMELGPRADRPD
jgi:hypothetical protein